MESLTRSFNQFTNLYQSMSASQRGTLIAVPLMLIVAFGIVMFHGSSSSMVALSWGKVFDTQELISAEQTLIEAGLNDFRREGQRIMVPAKDVDRYNAALVAGGALPTDSSSELMRDFQQFSSPFTTSQQQEQWKEIKLKQEIRRVLRAVPAIEDAEIIWARGEKPRGLLSKPKVTATVFVRPRHGRELSMPLVESLRAAVVNMVPDLEATDVAIFDQATGISHAADKEGSPFDSRLLTRIRQFEQLNREKISHALSSITDVLVTVTVDLDNLQRSVETTQTYDQKQSVALRARELSNSVKSTQQIPNGEPGQQSNTPRQLSQTSTPAKSHEVTETDSDTVTIPAYTLSEKTYIAAMPKAVKVSVAVPDDYYRAIALKEGLTEGTTDQEKAAFKNQLKTIETEENARVTQTLLTLLPAGSPTDAVSVQKYVRLPATEPEPISPPLTQTLGEVVTQWGSAVALGLFALWALWMVHKSLTRLPTVDAEDPATLLAKLTHTDESDSEEASPKELTKRDRLQMAVRDNPEVAASVLSKWIQTAN